MHKEGHIGAALFFYAPLGFLIAVVSGSELAIYGGIVVSGLAMLPDIDMKLPLVRHRGPTHTLWFAVGVGAIMGVLGEASSLQNGIPVGIAGFLAGFLLGSVTMASHIAADALTPAGVEPFAPLRDEEYSYGLVKAANPIANYALLALGLAVSLIALVIAQSIG